MSTAPNRTQHVDPLEQILERQRELVLQREYQVLGTVDFIWVVRGASTVKMDYRKSGPRLGFNPETGDMLVLSGWQGGLPNLLLPEAQPCSACQATCGDCNGTGKKPCTLAGCAGTGYNKNKYVPCPNCLGSAAKKTFPDCWQCNGRGEVPEPEKCKGCDEQGLAQCPPCRGTGKVSTGRAGGKKDGIDPGTRVWTPAPTCKPCNGQGRTVKTQTQDWRQFVNGKLGNRIAIGPIQRILWHTPGENSRFQEAQVSPDADGNLMVLLLDFDRPGAMQHLIGGVVQIK